MIIRFTEYVYPEEWDFVRIVRNAGYAHQVDGATITDKLYYEGGTRELAIYLEVDTETGVITVARDQTSQGA